MSRSRRSFKILLAVFFTLALATLATGSAAADSDVYQGIPFHPFTLDANNDTCIPYYDEELAVWTGNCDPVNLIFPGRTWQEVQEMLSTENWSTDYSGTSQSLHFGTAELHLEDQQLVKPGTYFSPRYHIRLWQAPGDTVVTFAAVHHEVFDWSSLNHVIDKHWEEAEADLAAVLCGQDCGQTGLLTTQSEIQGDDGNWRSSIIDGQMVDLFNNASATIVPAPDIPNTPPIATGDSYDTDQDAELNVPSPGVLSNDSDPDGDQLAAALITDVTNGMLTLNPDGSFDYQPDLGFVGNDSFTYVANDGASDSNSATVTITVNQFNYLPVAMNDTYSTDEDVPLYDPAPGVLSNDYDDDDDDLMAILVGDVSNGVLILNSDGSFSYTPDADFSGSDGFTYMANDGKANSNAATVTITVNPVVDPPIVDQTADGEIAVAGTVTGDFMYTRANDASAQTITERESGGKKDTRYSFLEHKWTFDVQSGNSVTFLVNAWRSSSEDGDAFVLAYSTDDNIYHDMVMVIKTGDDDTYQSYAMPANISGLVYIRVRDTDRSANHRSLDTFMVDHMLIRTQAESSSVPSTPTALLATAVSSSRIDLTWTDNADNESGFAIERSPNSFTWSEIDSVGPNENAYSDTGLTADTSYDYRVRAFNGSGYSAFSNTTTATTLPATDVTRIYALEGVAITTGPGSKWQATVIVTVFDESENPVEGAIVEGLWSDGVTGTGSCVNPTDSDGKCSVIKAKINGNVASVKFTVTDVVHGSMTYDPGGNYDVDFVVVDRPQDV